MSWRRFFGCAAVVFFMAGVVEAQFQRLGIRPQSLVIPAGGKPKNVEAFCMDGDLPAPPRTGVAYNFVAAGAEGAYVVRESGERIPFGDAVARNIISTSGAVNPEFGTGLGLSITSRVPERLKVEFGTPFVMASESRSDLITAKALKELTRSNASQDAIWVAEAEAGLLRTLGYDLGRTASENQEAVRRFQEREGLTVDGLIGDQTRAALARRTAEVQNGLAEVGELDSNAPLDRQIAALQKDEGTEVTGRYDNSFSAAVAARQAYARSIIKLERDQSVTPFSLLDTPDKFVDVVAFQRGSYGTSVLTRRNGRIEYWVTNVFGTSRVAHGPDAVRGFGRGVVSGAPYRSEPERFFVATGVVEGGKVPMALGPGIVELPVEKLHAFADGRAASLPELDSLLAEVKKLGVERPQIVFLHSPLAFARVAIDAELVDTAKLAGAAQRSYGRDVDVFVATDMELASENAAAIPKVRGGEVQIVKADGVRYNSKVSEIVGDLETAGIRTISASPDEKGGSAPATIFMGHKDAAYRGAVLQLAERGVFKDGILVTASCGEAGEALFNAKLIRMSGARAVIYYEGTIKPDLVQKVLVEFTKRLPPNTDTSEDFRTLWNASVNAVVGREPNADVRTHLQTLRNPLIQISDANGLAMTEQVA